MLLSALPSSWNPNQEVKYRRWEELEGEVLEELLMGIPQLIERWKMQLQNVDEHCGSRSRLSL